MEHKMAYNYSNDYGSYNTKKWADLLNQTSNQTSNQASNETSNQTQTTGDQSTIDRTSNQTSNQADNCGNNYSQAFTDFSGLDAIDQMNFQQNRQSQKTTPPDQV
ncbi:MAG: hypothetical protein LBL98_03685 [Ruminococcus sp.]|nr:hypothetical protein [Ruminococcus sp.]